MPASASIKALSLALGLAAIAGEACAQARFAATCLVVSQGFWESGAPIPAPVQGEESEAYHLAAFPDGLAATYLGDMTLFVKCATTGDVIRCAETSSAPPSRKADPDLVQSLELNRKTGEFHVVVQRKSKPAVRRDSRGTCVFDD